MRSPASCACVLDAVRGRSLTAAGLGWLACASLAVSCRSEEARPAQGAIVVVVDSLRADRLGGYGHRPSVTPAIDAFGGSAVRFDEAIAQAPSTLASVTSILTSLIPQHHGASVARGKGLGSDQLTLAEVARAMGLATAAFVGGGQLDAGYGIAQGFETYVAMARGGDEPKDRFSEGVARGLAWLDAHRGQRFLLLLHTYEAHHPYTPSPGDLAAVEPSGYSGSLPAQISIELLESINSGHTPCGESDLRHVAHAYEAGIHAVDAAFGELVAGLRRLGLDERTLLVLTADHGEEFGEHGKVGWHGHTLYDELLRVPLLVKYPGSWRGGSSYGGQVRGIDVAPSVLAGLGLPIPGAFEGSDLGAALRGDVSPAPYAVSAIDGGGSAVRSSEWKWDRRRLFHLSLDPGETRDVAAEHPGEAEKLRRIKQELVTEALPAHTVAAQASPELQERLRALGYVE